MDNNLEIRLRDILAKIADKIDPKRNESLEFVVMLSTKYRKALTNNTPKGHHFALVSRNKKVETLIGLNGDISHMIWLSTKDLEVKVFNKVD